MRIAVIGAGLSGLVAARELCDCSEVTVFEKSRGPGGRMATRYGNGFEFDHGAQFFTARSTAFREYLQPLIAEGVVACWQPRFAELHRNQVKATRDWDEAYPHYVGAPRMNAIGKRLAQDLDVRFDTTIATMERIGRDWRLSDAAGAALGHFDWVVCTMPAAQTASLAPAGSLIRQAASRAAMRACFALMLGFEESLSLSWQAALVRDADISWISVNSSKPGRPDAYTLVVHSTNAYADAHIDEEGGETVMAHLLREVSDVTGTDCRRAAFRQLQRWRYANADRRGGVGCLVDAKLQLAACGDWFRRGRVEAAFGSGLDLADRMRAQIT